MQFQPEHEILIESVPINRRGEDWIMLDEARCDYPYRVESKQDDRGFSRVYESFEQATGDLTVSKDIAYFLRT